VAKPELGAKQVCPTCVAKFYDLNRRPARCPKCGSEFDPEEAVKTRRIRARVATPDYEADEEAEDQVKAPAEDVEEEEEVVAPEIDEVVDEPVLEDEDEDAAAAAPAAAEEVEVDLEDEVDLDDDDAVPFLVEDGDDDFEEEIDGLPEEGEEDDR
jgi:uncharacterized protein (TIGR02300 family)